MTKVVDLGLKFPQNTQIKLGSFYTFVTSYNKGMKINIKFFLVIMGEPFLGEFSR